MQTCSNSLAPLALLNPCMGCTSAPPPRFSSLTVDMATSAALAVLQQAQRSSSVVGQAAGQPPSRATGSGQAAGVSGSTSMAAAAEGGGQQQQEVVVALPMPAGSRDSGAGGGITLVANLAGGGEGKPMHVIRSERAMSEVYCDGLTIVKTAASRSGGGGGKVVGLGWGTTAAKSTRSSCRAPGCMAWAGRCGALHGLSRSPCLHMPPAGVGTRHAVRAQPGRPGAGQAPPLEPALPHPARCLQCLWFCGAAAQQLPGGAAAPAAAAARRGAAAEPAAAQGAALAAALRMGRPTPAVQRCCSGRAWQGAFDMPRLPPQTLIPPLLLAACLPPQILKVTAATLAAASKDYLEGPTAALAASAGASAAPAEGQGKHRCSSSDGAVAELQQQQAGQSQPSFVLAMLACLQHRGKLPDDAAYDAWFGMPQLARFGLADWYALSTQLHSLQLAINEVGACGAHA